MWKLVLVSIGAARALPSSLSSGDSLEPTLRALHDLESSFLALGVPLNQSKEAALSDAFLSVLYVPAAHAARIALPPVRSALLLVANATVGAGSTLAGRAERARVGRAPAAST